MLRRATVTILAIAALGGAAGAAAAGPTPNGHNCAGVVVSGAAGPGFGSDVAVAAHAQRVDNFGFANCFQDHRNNP
jgi:hypothetical protein